MSCFASWGQSALVLSDTGHGRGAPSQAASRSSASAFPIGACTPRQVPVFALGFGRVFWGWFVDLAYCMRCSGGRRLCLGGLVGLGGHPATFCRKIRIQDVRRAEITDLLGAQELSPSLHLQASSWLVTALRWRHLSFACSHWIWQVVPWVCSLQWQGLWMLRKKFNRVSPNSVFLGVKYGMSTVPRSIKD
ncbi:uncharacterized protein EV420DRAFT_168167 [Desarmillaria tabescens]|uniref:Uncharacterized protein n=1 Tax=Armillaria tabescens TaxID=1929756 RepID=A0AA39N8G3_ARMTA|nr:uncharacterized protein EV420DRAFT_168167 [Desarmillaria tabescens]KAK0460954.1 hypothetical protein EV420DRAFT_168167 [Desarmillaria tabescens]